MYQFATYKGARVFPREARDESQYDCPLCGSEVKYEDKRFVHTLNEPNCDYYRDNKNANLKLGVKYFMNIAEIDTFTINRNCRGSDCVNWRRKDKPEPKSTVIILNEVATMNCMIDEEASIATVNYYLAGDLRYVFKIVDDNKKVVPDIEDEWFLLTAEDIINSIAIQDAFTCIRNYLCDNCASKPLPEPTRNVQPAVLNVRDVPVVNPKKPIEEKKKEDPVEEDYEEDFSGFSFI